MRKKFKSNFQNFFSNKKADIPITILVIGVVVICGFALLSFLGSSFLTKQNFTGIEEMENLNSKINQYYFYKEKGLSDQKINDILNINDKKIYVEKNKKIFSITGIKEKFLFSAEYRIFE